MASMQQKGGAQPHPSSSTAQQQPTYNVSSSMGWGQSMGMQNPGMGIRNPRMGYSMMPMCPMYGQPWYDRNRVWNESWNAVSKTTIILIVISCTFYFLLVYIVI